MKFYFRPDLDPEIINWIIVERFPNGLDDEWVGRLFEHFFAGKEYTIWARPGYENYDPATHIGLLYNDTGDVEGIEYKENHSAFYDLSVLMTISDRTRGAWVDEHVVEAAMFITIPSYVTAEQLESDEFISIINDYLATKIGTIKLIEGDIRLLEVVDLQYWRGVMSKSDVSKTSVNLEVELRNMFLYDILDSCLPTQEIGIKL